MKRIVFNLFAIFVMILTIFETAHAVDCTLPKNKKLSECANDGGTSNTVIVDAAIIDRENDRMTLLGANFLSTTTVTYAGGALTNISVNSTGTELYLAFDNVFSAVIQRAGTYFFMVDGNNVPVYINGLIPNTFSTTCPCENDWARDFNTESGELLTRATTTACIETNIDGKVEIVSTYTLDELLNPPVYIVGADFSTELGGVCQTVVIDALANESRPTKHAITAVQQSACATVMLDNPVICKP